MATDRFLAGQVALVTGAGRGIGRAHALAFAGAGASVVVNDVDPEPGDAVVAEIPSNGGTAEYNPHDVGSIDGGGAAVQFALETFGRVDVVINNAGFALGGGTVEDPVESELDALMAVHYKAAIGTMRAALPGMRARGRGRIINTVSEVALSSKMGGSLGYSAAKAAVWSLTISTAAELAASGITVNAISPGARTRMNADMVPSELDLAPEHVARVALFLASDEAADVTGAVIHAAGGHIREYDVTRSGTTRLVDRITSWEHTPH